MKANPYESPTVDETKPRAARLEERRRSVWELALIGLVAGGMIGATAGAMAAGALGLAAGMIGLAANSPLHVEDGLVRPDPAGLAFFGAILGCMLGGIVGSPLGLGSGIFAGLVSSRQRQLLMVANALLAGAGGALLGVLGGYTFYEREFAAGAAWLFLGGGLGLIAGVLGGLVLGRGLGFLAWGRPRQKTPVSSSEPEAIA